MKLDKVHTNNIIALILGVIVLVLVLRYQEPALAFLSTVKRIGPGNSPEDMTLGLIVIGFCGGILLAIVRILTNTNRND